jgi:ABC-type lipoprotein export system ATPase subunit
LRGVLPGSTQELLTYEEKYIAPQYFAIPRHLRWSHYLVFVVPQKTWQIATSSGLRQNLERDTTFARKFIVPENEAETFFAQSIVADSKEVPSDPVSAWTEALEKAGLGDTVYAQNRAPAVEAWISQKRTPPPRVKPVSKETTKGHIEDGLPLTAVRWKDFRPFPTRKEFQFGTVNLICGPNGAGKTSLLEAIETFFCGGTLRNGPVSSSDVEAKLGDQDRFLKLRYGLDQNRSRDMRWFGAYWRRKHELTANFNRYIFFNSDSAFRLEHDDGGEFVTSALANVALGPDATDLWGRIREFRQVFMVERERLKKRKSENDTQLASLKAQIGQFKRAPLHSEPQLKAMQESLRGIGWKDIPKALEKFEVETSSSLLEIASRLGAYAETFPVSVRVGKVDEYRIRLEGELNRAHRNRKARSAAEKELEDLLREQVDQSEKRKKLERLLEYFGVEWFPIEQMYKKAELIVLHLSKVLADGQVEEQLDQLSEESAKSTFSETRIRIGKEQDALRAELRRLRAVSKGTQRTRDALTSLIENIRALGRSYVEKAPETLDCPLCGHKHMEGELEKILHSQTSRDLGAKEVANALAVIADLERTVAIKEAQIRALSFVERFYKQITGKDIKDTDLTLGTVRAQLVQTVSESRKQDAERERAARTLRSLGKMGFSEEELDEIYKALRLQQGSSRTDAPPSKDKVEKSRSDVNQSLAKIEKETANRKATIAECDREIRGFLPELTARTGFEVVLERRERALELVKGFIGDMRQSSKMLGAPENLSVSAFLRELAIARDVSQQLSTSISTERSHQSSLMSLEKQRQAHEQAGQEISRQLDRADSAVGALGDIIRKYDLEQEVGRFIDENRENISEILRKIHAPKEFIGIAPLDLSEQAVRIRLQREGKSSQHVELSQISTGQRTALALSIFFTLNARMRLAPPIIIMDDPVTHVDDLNMLALLDYLRESAISNRRQIFFATANDKLAGIFEQKFLPLGEQFKKIELTRTN